MIKVSVMYPNTPGAKFDHAYYKDKHMPLVKARMGEACKFYTVDKGVAGGAQLVDDALPEGGVRRVARTFCIHARQ